MTIIVFCQQSLTLSLKPPVVYNNNALVNPSKLMIFENLVLSSLCHYSLLLLLLLLSLLSLFFYYFYYYYYYHFYHFQSTSKRVILIENNFCNVNFCVDLFSQMQFLLYFAWICFRRWWNLSIFAWTYYSGCRICNVYVWYDNSDEKNKF